MAKVARDEARHPAQGSHHPTWPKALERGPPAPGSRVGDAGDLPEAEAAGLRAALVEIAAAAFVVWADGRIALANHAGCALRAEAPELVLSCLKASIAGRDGPFHARRISTPGSPRHYLAVQRHGAGDPGPRVAAAEARWHLTPRQAAVLALLALGKANKTIAATLGCAEATVEVHVSALLAKSACEGRCELVSRFWSQPIG